MLVALALFGPSALPILAQQHTGHAAVRDTSRQRGELHMQHRMMAAGPLGISAARQGSGTSWLPDLSAMYAHHAEAGRWEFMLHYNSFLQYIEDGSSRGDNQLGSINWLMGMARRPVGDGAVQLRAMMSVEPLTVGSCGYPDLLATGELCDGEPLHDRQHPHDLFMELAMVYERAITSNLALQLYGGPVGEPALGPVAYPHRISALANPIAPIGHHWMDATHISFGVATAGLFGRKWKLEGSLFNGREPDEDRYDFDLARLDSYAGRLSILPDERWAFQISVGRLNDAEPAHESGEPRRDITRPTASVIYHHALGAAGTWTSALVWGRNIEEGQRTDAFLAESSLSLDERNVFFARAELAEKPGEDLALEDERLQERTFNVGKVQLGYVRQFAPTHGLLPGIGASVALNFVPDALEPFYGRIPGGFLIFASLRPAPMHMEQMAAGEMPHGATPADAHSEHQAAPRPWPDSAIADTSHAGHERMPDARQIAAPAEDQLRLMREIHMRMMADPVIRERVATDPVLQRMLENIERAGLGDTLTAHSGHRTGTAAADSAEARQIIEFVTLLVSDPQIEARVHADPKLHRLWSDPEVQHCLETMRRLRASGQPLPPACPAAPPAGVRHRSP